MCDNNLIILTHFFIILGFGLLDRQNVLLMENMRVFTAIFRIFFLFIMNVIISMSNKNLMTWYILVQKPQG